MRRPLWRTRSEKWHNQIQGSHIDSNVNLVSITNLSFIKIMEHFLLPHRVVSFQVRPLVTPTCVFFFHDVCFFLITLLHFVHCRMISYCILHIPRYRIIVEQCRDSDNPAKTEWSINVFLVELMELLWCHICSYKQDAWKSHCHFINNASQTRRLLRLKFFNKPSLINQH